MKYSNTLNILSTNVREISFSIGRLTAASPNAKRSGSAPGLRSARVPARRVLQSQFRRPAFSRSSSLRSPTFSCSTRSRAPIFPFAVAHTYQNWGWVPCPPGIFLHININIYIFPLSITLYYHWYHSLIIKF